jgi:hypothetical protein
MPLLHEVARAELHTPVGRRGGSIFLRACDDEATTIDLAGHSGTGVRRTNLRPASADALPLCWESERYVAAGAS